MNCFRTEDAHQTTKSLCVDNPNTWNEQIPILHSARNSVSVIAIVHGNRAVVFGAVGVHIILASAHGNFGDRNRTIIQHSIDIVYTVISNLFANVAQASFDNNST
jgi:hypothetical protein